MNAAQRDHDAAVNEAVDAITGLSQREEAYVLSWLNIHYPSELIAAAQAARAATAKRLERASSAAENAT